jgi:hypothetical protein
MDKVMRLASMTEYSVSPFNINGANFNTKSTGKSLSSRSHSSKSSSQASHKNGSSAVRSNSSVRSSSSSVPPFTYSYADFSQVNQRKFYFTSETPSHRFNSLGGSSVETLLRNVLVGPPNGRISRPHQGEEESKLFIQGPLN